MYVSPKSAQSSTSNTQICRLEGGMTPQQRDATIQHFSELTLTL